MRYAQLQPQKQVLKKKEEICCLCNELGKVAQRTDDGPVCTKCYGLKHYYDPWKHDFCVNCGEHKPVARRTHIGHQPVCPSCVSKMPEFHELCTFCGDFQPVKRRIRPSNQPVCGECVALGLVPQVRRGSRRLKIRGISPSKLVFRRCESV